MVRSGCGEVGQVKLGGSLPALDIITQRSTLSGIDHHSHNYATKVSVHEQRMMPQAVDSR